MKAPKLFSQISTQKFNSHFFLTLILFLSFFTISALKNRMCTTYTARCEVFRSQISFVYPPKEDGSSQFSLEEEDRIEVKCWLKKNKQTQFCYFWYLKIKYSIFFFSWKNGRYLWFILRCIRRSSFFLVIYPLAHFWDVSLAI